MSKTKKALKELLESSQIVKPAAATNNDKELNISIPRPFISEWELYKILFTLNRIAKLEKGENTVFCIKKHIETILNVLHSINKINNPFGVEEPDQKTIDDYFEENPDRKFYFSFDVVNNEEDATYTSDFNI